MCDSNLQSIETEDKKRVKRRGDAEELTEEETARYEKKTIYFTCIAVRRNYGVRLGYRCGLARQFEEEETGQLYDEK